MNAVSLNNYLDVCHNFVHTNEYKEEILKYAGVLYKNDIIMTEKIIVSLLELQKLRLDIAFFTNQFNNYKSKNISSEAIVFQDFKIENKNVCDDNCCETKHETKITETTNSYALSPEGHLIQKIREIISLMININNMTAGVYQHISVYIRNKEILSNLLTLFIFLDKHEHSDLVFSSLFSKTKNIVSDSVASILMKTGNSLFARGKFTLAKIFW